MTTRELVLHIEKGPVSIVTQADLLGIARSTVYYRPQPTPEEELLVMRAIDEVYTECPFYGSRRMAHEVSDRLTIPVNRKRTQRLMDIMGIEAIFPKRNLSFNPTSAHRFPYLLTGVTAARPNHIWGTDITYIRLRNGFVYLLAFLDWFSRYTLS